MNTKLIHYINAGGIIALAALCAYQWHGEACLQKQLHEAHKKIATQKATLAERDESIRGLSADLSFFKEQFSGAKNEADAARAAKRETEKNLRQIERDRETLLANEATFQAAIKERDAVIADAGEQLKKIAGEATDVVKQYNLLAEKFNATVEELNASRRETAQALADLTEARGQLRKLLPPEK